MNDEVTAIDTAHFKEVLGHFATGLTIVTAMAHGLPVGFTCQAFNALSLEPPLVALAPSKSSTSWPRMREAGAFCVNILADGQEALCRAFAAPGADKFRGVGWTQGSTGAPVLNGVLASIDCSLEVIHDAGDHELVIGRVVDLAIGEGTPLLYYRGGFGSFSA